MSKKRADILVVANRLFNQYGFINVGVDKIINEANVAKMTFYKYFPSKNKLINQCLLERDNFIRNSLLNELRLVSDSSLSKLYSIFIWHKEWFEQEDFFGCMFIKATDELITDKISRKTVIDHKFWIISIIRSILDELEIDNTAQVARQISSLLDGAIINENVFKDGKAISDAWLVTLKILDLTTLNIPDSTLLEV